MTSATAPSRTRQAAAPTPRARRAQAIAVGLADIRGEPDAASELVTQALLGASAIPLDSTPSGWTRVRLVDYEGWARSDQLGAPTRPTERVAVVMATRAPLYAAWRGASTLGEVFASSLLPIAATGQRAESGRVRVALPGGRAGWIAVDVIEQRPASDPFPPRGPEAAVALAKSLLDTPYLWGGVTQRGIDCSGLTQLACRVGGVVIPRDANQQYDALRYIVDRADVRLGDLVYFAGHGAVTHVGIALDNMTLLHASGAGKRVMVNSLDPAAGGDSVRLAASYAGVRRPFADEAGQR